MSSLRVVVSFPGQPAPPLEEQTQVLNELMRAMKDSMGLNERLTRLPEMQLPGAQRPAGQTQTQTMEEVPLRVFLLEFPDGASCDTMLRAIGSWYMRHPRLTVSMKADGPRGGINLKLTSFTMVSFAAAAAKINPLMVPAEDS